MIEDFDAVTLKDGRVGAVVEIYDNGNAFEVEFLDDEGYTNSGETIDLSEIVSVAKNHST